METLRKITETGEETGREHKRLTVTELRNCKGFENYTDEQAEETIRTLEALSILFFELYQKHKQQEERLALLKKREYGQHNRAA